MTISVTEKVVILPVVRIEREKHEPLQALLSRLHEDDGGKVLYCSPPIKDTAPAEYVAPPDDCA